ncbi:MAG: FixH family protein [Pseudobdellovibrio sp.]
MKFLFWCLSALLISCAKPNYPVSSSPENGKQQVVPTHNDPANPAQCSLFFKTSHLCLSYKWAANPKANEMSSMTFQFYVQEKPAVFVTPSQSVNVQLWMPSMGHGSSPVKVSKNTDNSYKAENVFFVMPGTWEIRFQLKAEQDVVEQVVDKITIQ